MIQPLREIREWTDVDAESFHEEIVPLNQPAVLRGLVAQWPAVRQAMQSPSAMCAYLKRFDAGGSTTTLLGASSIKGKFFYSDDMHGLNFERKREPLDAAIERLKEHLADPDPPAISSQAMSVADHLPGFARENSLTLVDPSITPRLWINNATTVVAHFDPKDNIACVVCGRRRFTLFPPDQISNLYVGPLQFTLAGPWVSMAPLEEPDFERYPRFKEALAAAQTAELGPGDAIYIPYLWWHHVRSLEPLNVLVNYWWNAAMQGLGSPFDAFYHALLALSALPATQRAAWRAVFDYYVFQTSGAPAEHLALRHRGLLGPMTPALAAKLKSLAGGNDEP